MNQYQYDLQYRIIDNSHHYMTARKKRAWFLERKMRLELVEGLVAMVNWW